MTEVTDYITELIPQNQYTNLPGIIEKIAVETHKNVSIHPLNESEWLRYLSEHPTAEFTRIFGSDDLNDLDTGKGNVNWIQNGYFIQVTLFIARDEVQCDTEGIESPILTGKWFGSVSDIEINDLSTDGNNLVQIEFNVDRKWPLLIKGGYPDKYSAFYIAEAALDQSLFDVFEEYLTYSALQECYSAMKTIAMVKNDQKCYGAAINWYCRCIILHDDLTYLYFLADQLLRGEGIKKNEGLAEFILCRLCIEKFVNAFYLLGKLYLTGSEDQQTVKPMKNKARFFLEKFVNDSMLTLGPDDDHVKDAINLLENEDFTPTAYEIEQDARENEQTNQEAHTPETKTTVLDWALAGSVVASIGAVGLYAFKRFMKNH